MAVPTKSGHQVQGGPKSKAIVVAQVMGTNAQSGAGAPWMEVEGMEQGSEGQLLGITAGGCPRRPRLLGMGLFSHPYLKGLCSPQGWPPPRIPVQPKATTPTATRLIA